MVLICSSIPFPITCRGIQTGNAANVYGFMARFFLIDYFTKNRYSFSINLLTFRGQT